MERMNGFYMVYYQSANGHGNLAAVIKDGIVQGMDCTKGKTIGTCNIIDDIARINVSVLLTGSPDTHSVVGGVTGPVEQIIEFDVPVKFRTPHKVQFKTNFGPVMAEIHQIA